jgi:NADH-quinone oxidoreductase subunit N
MYLTSQTISRLQTSLGVDVFTFLPEIIVCTAIVLLLFLRLFPGYEKRHMGVTALIFVLLALLTAYLSWPGNLLAANRDAMNGWLQKIGLGDTIVGLVDLLSVSPETLNAQSKSQELFTGLLVYDNFTVFLRMFLFGATAIMIWLSMLTNIPDQEDSADFYVLLLGASVGMSLMASANHLLMVFIGVEMASLPSYALAGFLKGKRQSSEAALKYVVYGGGAAGIMLYGISLVAGKFGTGYLPDVATGLLTTLKLAPQQGLDPVLVLGTLFILVGFGFKLAAVPFHFWCPDVFEGAAAEVAAFLSVVSKGAALALFGRFTLMLAGMGRGLPITVDYATWLQVAQVLGPAIAFIAAITATFGNLAAYAQTNLKRLLAYSTIAHAGYMMMGLAPLSRDGAAAVLFYLVAYLFMNLGAFAIVAFLRNLTGTEDLSGYRGMIAKAPLLTVLLAIFLLSLLGMPPLAGFAAKFQIFSVLFNAGKTYSDAAPGLGYTMYALLVIGGLNTAVSAMYYMKVLRVMILDRSVEQIEGEAIEPLPVSTGWAVFGTLMAAMLVVLGILWNPLANASDVGANRFNNSPRPGETARTVSKVDHP